MKLLFSSLCTLCLFSTVFGEVLITSSNSPNSIVVASNQAVIITSIREAYDSFTPNSRPATISGIIVSGGKSNEVAVPFNSDRNLALAGPATFILPRADFWGSPHEHLVSYKTISSSFIKTVLVPKPFSGQTNQIDIFVPAGKTIHCFPPFDYVDGGLVTIPTGTSMISVPVFGGEEFSGPLTITIQSAGFMFFTESAKAFSYYLLEDFFVVPQSGLLQGPTGSFDITIEKSANLMNWFPAVIHPTSDDQQAFYRLKLSR